MNVPTRIALSTPDPMVAALEIGCPIDAAVLKSAIDYRTSLIDQLQREIEILQATRARMLNEPAA